MRRGWTKLGAILFAAIGITIVADVLSVDAAGVNIWAPNSKPILSKVESPNKNLFSVCETKTIKVGYVQSPLLNLREKEVCVFDTPYGSASHYSNYMRFSNAGAYREVDAWYGIFRAIPQSTKVLVWFPSSYRFGIYDDARNAFQSYNSNGITYLKPSIGSRLLKNPYNQDSVYGRSSGVSSNGKWLVLETGGGFVRFNLQTEEMINLGKIPVSYGGGRDPSYNPSITDDGRYVKISGANYSDVKIIDAQSCVSTKSEDPIGTYAKCEELSLGQMVREKDQSIQTVYGYDFRSGGRELLIEANTGTPQYKKSWYIVTAQGQLTQNGYVALGDSYSSGEGDRDDGYYLSGTNGSAEYSNEKCHNSRRSYPYLLNSSASSGIFYSFACSGAQTEDVLGMAKPGRSKYYGSFNQLEKLDSLANIQVQKQATNMNILGRAPQYQFIEKFQPKNITLTIGGNDVDFGKMLESCVTKSLDNSTCSWATYDKAAKGRGIQSAFSKLRETYLALKKTSAGSNIYVLSYPQFVSSKSACGLNVQLDSAEREFIRESVRYLNDVIEQAAKSAGVTYIDIENSLAGHELCSGDKNLAVNGITFGDDMSIGMSVLGNELLMIGHESFHPNEYGHSLIASYVKNTYGNLPNLDGVTCTENDCSTYTSPPVPSYFGTGPTTPVATKQDFIMDTIEDGINWFERSQQLRVRLWTGERNAVTKLQLHSEPVDLGSVKTDDNGYLDTIITIPANTSLGAHAIHAYATVNGENTDYYQPVYVVASKDDIDGDGVLNANDSCEFIEPSGVDDDKDGVDDSCDGIMNETAVNGVGTTTPGSTVDQAVVVNPTDNTPAVSAVLGDEMLAAEVLVGNRLPNSSYDALATVRTMASEALTEWGITDSRVRAQAVDIGWVGVQAAAVLLPLGAGAALWRKKLRNAL